MSIEISAEEIINAMTPYERAQFAWVSDLAPMPLWDWQLENRPKLRAGVTADWQKFKFLPAIYQCQASSVTVKKPGQSGASEYVVSDALHTCDMLEGNVLYLFPQQGTVGDFVRTRIDPAIEASAYLKTLVRKGGGKRKGADNVGLKMFGDFFIFFRGAGNVGNNETEQGTSNLVSITVRKVIYDEFDRMHDAIEDYGDKRMGAYDDPQSRFISTPTYEDVGVDAKYERGDQRRWYIPCPHCGHWQTLYIGHVVIEWDALERPKRWHGQSEGRAYCACEKCGRELDRLADGEWVATYPSRSAHAASFHWNKLIVPTAKLYDPSGSIVTEGKGLINALSKVDETARRQAFNQDLAETFNPAGERITDSVLNRCVRQYMHADGGYVKPHGRKVFAGVDVGNRKRFVTIRESADERGDRKQLYSGVVRTFTEVSRLLDRYKVDVCVVDANPEHDEARRFQETRPKQVWLAYYPNMPKGTTRAIHSHFVVEEGARSVDPPHREVWYGKAMIDRTWSLDVTFGRFYTASKGEGGNTLPANAAQIGDYYKHMKALKKVTERDKQNNPVSRYIHKQSEPDDFAHAENYITVAEAAPEPPRVWYM